jgi:hypothetical protein
MEGSQKISDVPLHASLDWTSTLSRGVMLRFISPLDFRMFSDPRLCIPNANRLVLPLFVIAAISALFQIHGDESSCFRLTRVIVLARSLRSCSCSLISLLFLGCPVPRSAIMSCCTADYKYRPDTESQALSLTLSSNHISLLQLTQGNLYVCITAPLTVCQLSTPERHRTHVLQ